MDVWTDTTGTDSTVLAGTVWHYRNDVIGRALGMVSGAGNDGTADADGFGLGNFCTVGASDFGGVLVGCDLRKFAVAVFAASGAKPGGLSEIC